MSFLIRSSGQEGREGDDPNTDIDSFDETIPENHKPNDPDTNSEDKPIPASSSSVIKFYPECCNCFGSSALEYPMGENATFGKRIRYFLQCPPIGPLAKITVFLSIFALGWLILDFLIGPIAGAAGPICAVLILEVIGLLTGLTMRIFGLPTLLAPLVLGIILRNVDVIDVFELFKYPFTPRYCSEILNYTSSSNSICCQKHADHAASEWIRPIRQIALTLILTRAGTELSPKQLRKLKGVVPALAFIPCVTEALTCAVMFKICYLSLSPEPSIPMCLVAGFAISAVSPAVVVPAILSLARKGYGVLQGIPTLLIAASSIDDVLAISLYTVALAYAIEDNNENGEIGCANKFVDGLAPKHERVSRVLEIAGGPLGIIVGIIYGIIVGCILHFLPSKDTKSKGNLRLVLLLCCNISCMLGFSSTGFLEGAGSLGVLTTSFVASFGWRSQAHWKPSMHQVESKLTHLWTLFVPILFGTIGKEMRFVPDKNDQYFKPEDLEMLKNTHHEYHPFDLFNIVRIIGIILVSLIVRCTVVFFLVIFAGLNRKERLFIALSWIPKATVQAALAPLVLTTVIEKGVTDIRVKTLAYNIVVMAVFAILITAPVGAILISLTGPRLLQKITPTEIEDEFPNGEADPNSTADEDTYYHRRASLRASRSVSQNNSVMTIEKPSAVEIVGRSVTGIEIIGESSQTITDATVGGQEGRVERVRWSDGSDTGRTENATAERVRWSDGSDTGRTENATVAATNRFGSKGDNGLPRDIP